MTTPLTGIDTNDKMEKICRSMVNIYRLPKVSHLNLRLNATISPSIYHNNYSNQYNHGTSVGSFHSQNNIVIRHYNSSSKPPGLSGAKVYSSKKGQDDDGSPTGSIVDILEREIQDETAELSQHLSTDQFPGFSVETDGSDVKLTKQVGDVTVSVRFTVSSSLNEWPDAPDSNQQNQQQQQQQQDMELPSTKLVSMPEFQVSITKKGHTLEMNCYFEEMEQDEETGEPIPLDPVFGIDELVMYEGEPKETEFAVSVEYFQDQLQEALLQYLSEYGINEEFAVNLVDFATSYEKKQYIGLMKRLKNFVS